MPELNFLRCVAALAVFVFTPVSLVGESPAPVPICSALRSEGFHDRFVHAVAESEHCEGSCETIGLRMRDPIEVRVVSDLVTASQNEMLRNSLNWVLEDVASSDGIPQSINVVNQLSTKQSSAIVILPMTTDADKFLAQQGLPGLAPTSYQRVLQSIIRRGFCGGRVVATIEDNQSWIDLAYILVPIEKFDDLRELDLCLLEEITQSFGVFGDPFGSDSLFDDGNIDLSGSRPRTSAETKAMVGFLYSGKSLDRVGLEAFINEQC